VRGFSLLLLTLLKVGCFEKIFLEKRESRLQGGALLLPAFLLLLLLLLLSLSLWGDWCWQAMCFQVTSLLSWSNDMAVSWCYYTY